jgi:hypothetical protein
LTQEVSFDSQEGRDEFKNLHSVLFLPGRKVSVYIN